MSDEKVSLKKLTHDAVFGKITADKKPKAGTTIPTVRFLGAVEGYVEENGKFGPYVKFRGEFEAVNIATGEVFEAPALILPSKDEPAMLRKAFDQAQANGHPTVEFALDYMLAHTDKGERGYTFIARDASKPKGADPLARLRSSLPAVPKALTRK